MKPVSIFYMAVCLVVFKTAHAQTGYLKEKIYAHTNHVFFAPGDVAYFKLYLVNGADNKPSKTSNIVYVEITGPSGQVVEKQTYPVANGYCEGSYAIAATAPGGQYKLKAYTSWMRNEKDSSFFTKQFTVQQVITPRILMKLDFPEKGYGAGIRVTADFSMRSLEDEPIRNHAGKFAVSLDGKVQETRTFLTDANGKAKLLFDLPNSLQTTDGLLNVTVDYNAYTESIARSIPITLNKIDLQFMPEGGTLVAGIAGNIAFRAINEYGKPVDVKGNIVNSKGVTVASFSSYKFGMGQFLFRPAEAEVYTAVITSPANIAEKYLLPVATAQGLVMNISQLKDSAIVKLTATSNAVITLTARAKGSNYYSQTITLTKGEKLISINRRIFPAGITQFTAYAADGLPLAERLVFFNADKGLRVSIVTNKKQYQPREKVSMVVKTSDENGAPVPSNLSLSVIDDKLWSLADDKQDNIFSWLLMSSELKGHIEEPQFYFKKDEPKAAEALDLVMLTHGYRYFDFTDEVYKNKALKYPPDESNIVSGVLMDAKNEPVPGVVFLIHNVEGGEAVQQQTGSDGIFYFSSLLPKENYLLIAQPLQKKEQVSIKILQNGIGYNPLQTAAAKQIILDQKFGALFKPAPAQTPKGQAVNMDIALGARSSSLNEVVVTGYGIARKRDVTGAIAVFNTANTLSATPANGALQALQGKAAGVQVIPNGNPGETPVIRIRGARAIGPNDEPLIIIDGVPQQKFDVSTVDVNNIESITVFKDAAAIALYGSKAVNGVIVIQSKQLRNEKLRFDISRRHFYYTSEPFTLNAPAYTVARKFYIPKYAATAAEERTDYRETIYWNPVVQTGKDGNATVEFYNSDATTTFRAIAEGIGYNGSAGSAETTYIAKSQLTLDAKIPPYLTAGDTALIPLVIKNNSTEMLNGVVGVALPQDIKAANFDSAFSILPDSAAKMYIPVTATAATNGNIRFTAVAAQSHETVVLPVTVAEKGFPVIQSFSGNKDASHHIVINKATPGSLHATLTVYKDLEGQLLDGIESMLREPHGCFEQTSSTTYPNVFILKYLRRAHKSNAAVEKKALGYIEEGYKRLIGFETPENGFEWFGHAPAHEALTAYGLLEFTDMKEFIQVDEVMLKRAKNLLLKRRDGKGGFAIAPRGYDEFAAVPAALANTYIIYAVSEAGYGKEFEPEYHSAVTKALESNDAYRLAMMALAADNMKDEQDYNLLMDALKKAYLGKNLASETSVVNSRGASLRVESKALYALALMRSNTPDIGTVANLVSGILSEKSYYGYGSTQATLLALQAVTEYAKLAGSEASKTALSFTVNGMAAKAGDNIGAMLHEGDNTFGVDYANSAQGLPYNLEVAYNTFTPPTDEKAELSLEMSLGNTLPKIGETVRMNIRVTNKKDAGQPMVTAKIGIPAGLSLQPWQLKELLEKSKVAYYEIFDNYLVFYWMGFAPNETKQVALDLKAEIPGSYKAKAGNVYLYYTPEYKEWVDGVAVKVMP